MFRIHNAAHAAGVNGSQILNDVGWPVEAAVAGSYAGSCECHRCH
jgi:hypothetical protein